MAQTSIDDSKLGQLLLEAIHKKNEGETNESALKQQLLERIIAVQMNKTENPQKVLDSQYFNGLSLGEKINFINQHQALLGQKPNFSWGSVGKGGLASATLAGTGTLMHQIMTNAGKAPFKPNLWALGGAVALGGLVGATVNANREYKDYKKDLRTQRNIDDAISVLVDRGLSPVPTKTDYLAKVRSNLEEMPVNFGKNMSAVDFSKI